MVKPIRTAVVGGGYFGRFHALHYARNANAELVAVVDVDGDRGAAVAEEARTRTVAAYTDVIDQVDAVSITVPTSQHFEVARAFLEAGVHVLVEKPITSTLEDAAVLVDIADRKGLKLAVGHIERFSAPYLALRETVTMPRYIESYRISPWKPRATDVDVVLDLMIHDIDIILGLVDAPVSRVDAVGAPIINSTEDIANARITFGNGCVATVTASRISHKTQRTMRLFQPESYIVCDFGDSRIVHFSRKPGAMDQDTSAIQVDTREIEKHDSLGREIAEFLEAIANDTPCRVDGHAGLRALQVSSMIKDNIQAHWDATEDFVAAQPR